MNISNRLSIYENKMEGAVRSCWLEYTWLGLWTKCCPDVAVAHPAQAHFPTPLRREDTVVLVPSQLLVFARLVPARTRSRSVQSTPAAASRRPRWTRGPGKPLPPPSLPAARPRLRRTARWRSRSPATTSAGTAASCSPTPSSASSSATPTPIRSSCFARSFDRDGPPGFGISLVFWLEPRLVCLLAGGGVDERLGRLLLRPRGAPWACTLPWWASCFDLLHKTWEIGNRGCVILVVVSCFP